MLYLKDNLWDSVRMADGSDVPKASLVDKVLCRHKEKPVEFTHTDHRPGPGWMSDSYEGTACSICGKVFNEKKVY